jgi:crotonobetainyl-CoA:carnitine CoA-transferase CaiB-like acyl-CoA transferase
MRGAAGADGGALNGLRVVEIAQVIAGPMAGTLLADLGADVIHVEDPNEGDRADPGIADRGARLRPTVARSGSGHGGRNDNRWCLARRIASGS